MVPQKTISISTGWPQKGGTDPWKVRVGYVGANQTKLYLYYFPEKGGLFYSVFANLRKNQHSLTPVGLYTFLESSSEEPFWLHFFHRR